MAPTDLNSQQYYEALRCLIELANVAAYRLESAGGPTDRPRPSWDRIGGAMVVYFGLHTGVKLHLPEAG
jgi:hypothetical protein